MLYYLPQIRLRDHCGKGVGKSVRGRDSRNVTKQDFGGAAWERHYTCELTVPVTACIVIIKSAKIQAWMGEGLLKFHH